MDEEKKEAEKVDIFNPATIFAFVAAFIGDFTFFLIITHYLCALFAFGILLPGLLKKTEGIMRVLTVMVCLIAFVLPLPLILIAIILSIILANKFLAFVATQAAAAAATAFTGVGGVAVEGAAAAEAGAVAGEAAIEAGVAAAEASAAAAEAAAGAAEAATTAAEMEEMATAAAESAEAAGGAAKAGAEAEEAAQEAGKAGEVAEEGGEAKEEKSAFEKARDIKEKIDKVTGGGQEKEQEKEKEDEENEEERPLIGEQSRLSDELLGREGEIPKPPQTIRREEEGEATPKNNLASGERFKAQQKILDVRKARQKPKPIQEIQIREDEQEDKEDNQGVVKKAA